MSPEITTAEAYVLAQLHYAEQRAEQLEAAHIELKQALMVAIQSAEDDEDDVVRIPGHAFTPLRDLLYGEAALEGTEDA